MVSFWSSRSLTEPPLLILLEWILPSTWTRICTMLFVLFVIFNVRFRLFPKQHLAKLDLFWLLRFRSCLGALCGAVFRWCCSQCLALFRPSMTPLMGDGGSLHLWNLCHVGVVNLLLCSSCYEGILSPMFDLIKAYGPMSMCLKVSFST